MGHNLMHRTISAMEWTAGLGLTASAVGATVFAEGGSIDNWTNLFLIAAIGLGMLGAKLIELYAKFRAVDSESVQGKYARCCAEIERMKTEHSAAVGRNVSDYAAAESRSEKTIAAMKVQYEERLVQSQQEIKSLYEQIAIMRSEAAEKNRAIAVLNGQLANDAAVLVQVVKDSASILRTSVDNTGTLAKKLPRPTAVGEEMDVKTITANVEHMDVNVVGQDGNAGE